MSRCVRAVKELDLKSSVFYTRKFKSSQRRKCLCGRVVKALA